MAAKAVTMDWQSGCGQIWGVTNRLASGWGWTELVGAAQTLGPEGRGGTSLPSTTGLGGHSRHTLYTPIRQQAEQQHAPPQSHFVNSANATFECRLRPAPCPNSTKGWLRLHGKEPVDENSPVFEDNAHRRCICLPRRACVQRFVLPGLSPDLVAQGSWAWV